jgi:hypothetical protein
MISTAAPPRGRGIEVKDRGRVPADLMVKFQAATGQQG